VLSKREYSSRLPLAGGQIPGEQQHEQQIRQATLPRLQEVKGAAEKMQVEPLMAAIGGNFHQPLAEPSVDYPSQYRRLLDLIALGRLSTIVESRDSQKTTTTSRKGSRRSFRTTSSWNLSRFKSSRESAIDAVQRQQQQHKPEI